MREAVIAPRRAFRAIAAVVAASASIGAGCGGELPSPAVIIKLRLIAMTADAPEVRPGAGFRLRAVWEDGARAAPRDVYYLWRLCPEGPDREPRSCLVPSRGEDLADDTVRSGGEISVTIPASRVPLVGSAGFTVYFVLLALCPDAPPAFDAARGQYACPSEASIPNEMREGIQAVRRITVRSDDAKQPPLNGNPSIARVTVGGRDVADGERPLVARCPPAGSDPPCGGTAVVVYPTESSAERRVDATPETLLASFFTTMGGAFDRPRAVPSEGHPNADDGSLSAVWYPPSAAGAARLWFVLRDGRGGDSVRVVDVDVR